MKLPMQPLKLPLLPYSYDGLQPVYSVEQLKTHYLGHHGGYVKKFNELIAQENPNQEDLAFNYSGHVLHSLLWQNLTPRRLKPSGKFLQTLQEQDMWDTFAADLVDTGCSIKGSGWVIVAADKSTNEIIIETISNHDMEKVIIYKPLLILDAWEHAYYLDYKNKKQDYFEALLQIINWDVVEKRFNK